jgi:hypothetical protein
VESRSRFYLNRNNIFLLRKLSSYKNNISKFYNLNDFYLFSIKDYYHINKKQFLNKQYKYYNNYKIIYNNLKILKKYNNNILVNNIFIDYNNNIENRDISLFKSYNTNYKGCIKKNRKIKNFILLGLRLLIINNIILKVRNKNILKKIISNNFFIMNKKLEKLYRYINIINIYYRNNINYSNLDNNFNNSFYINRGTGIGGYNFLRSNLSLDNSFFLVSKDLIYSKEKDYNKNFLFNKEIYSYQNFYFKDRKILNRDLAKKSENIINNQFYRLIFKDNKYIYLKKEILNKVFLYYNYYD